MPTRRLLWRSENPSLIEGTFHIETKEYGVSQLFLRCRPLVPQRWVSRARFPVVMPGSPLINSYV